MEIKECIIKKLKTNVKLYRIAVKLDNMNNRLSKESHIYRVVMGVFNKKREFSKEALSVRNYCELNNIERHILEPEQYREEYEATYFEGAPERFFRFKTPDIYYCRLENVNVIGMQDMIVGEGYVLNDRFDYPYADTMDFTSQNIIENSKMGGYIVYVKKGKGINEAISLIGVASNNYYHWCFDIIAKIAYINKFLDLKDVPLLIDKSVNRHPTYLELLKKVDEYNHPLIFIDRGDLCNVLVLHYFSPVTFSNVYGKKKAEGEIPRYAKPQKVIELYRNAILPEAIKECGHKDMPKKVFLSRGVWKDKRLVNEDQVGEFLLNRGFTIINPEELTIVEQAGVFYSAEVIISDEGAALVNGMYCSKDTTVVCIMPKTWHNRQFTTIGYLSGAKCINLNATETGEGRYHVIDMKYLERFIDNL